MWTRCLGCLLLNCFSIGMLAQTVALPATIDGQVVSSLTGEAISGASISLLTMRRTRTQSSLSNAAATSNGDGTFHIDQVPPGTYYLQVRRPGFTTPMRSTTRPLIVTAGASLSDITLRLVPESTLAGRVQDEQSNPLSDMQMLALAPMTRDGLNSLEVRSQSSSDKQGSFSLQRLRPGTYYIVARPTPAETKSRDADLVTTIYPRSFDLDGATPITVTAGQSETGLNMMVRKVAVHVVEGKVAQTASDDNLRVTLAKGGSLRADVLNRRMRPAADGGFHFDDVPSGIYTLRLFARRSRLLTRTDIQVGAADVVGLVLTPAPLVSLTGTIRADPAVNSASLPAVQITAHSAEAPARPASLLAGPNTTGAFVFNDLEPIGYSFNANVQGSAGWYVKSIAVNHQDAQNRLVDLSGGGLGTIEIVVAQGAAELDGTVSDAPSDSSLGLVLAPDPPAADGANVLFAFTQAPSPFAFKNVPPGHYSLYAVVALQTGVWQNADFQRAMSPHAMGVVVKENDHLQVQVSITAQELADQVAEQLALNPE